MPPKLRDVERYKQGRKPAVEEKKEYSPPAPKGFPKAKRRGPKPLK